LLARVVWPLARRHRGLCPPSSCHPFRVESASGLPILTQCKQVRCGSASVLARTRRRERRRWRRRGRGD
jgi:hypothetical protein